jgi:hypothetical protein
MFKISNNARNEMMRLQMDLAAGQMQKTVSKGSIGTSRPKVGIETDLKC